MSLEPVRPVQPIAPWLGGKRALARRIGERIAEVPHTRYVEPFVGMGGVFFRRSVRPKLEVINDVNRDVVNLFRVLQRHRKQLLDLLEWQLYSRADFERLRATPADMLTDLERAARFLYLQKAGFGGMGKTFGVSYDQPRWNLRKVELLLKAAHERLQDVLIECLDFGTCIERYDSPPGTLFYCDPPYWGHTDDYGKDIFSKADFGRLRRILDGLQGRFILSLNDRPEVREMFAGFEMEEVSLNYRASGKVTPARELIISGP